MEKKTGLILEGGAMRGLFTAGVLDVWMEKGIVFDGAIGVSAGAAFGCNYKSRQIGRAYRYNTKYCNDWRYCSYRSLFLTGDLYGAKFCYEDIPLKLDPWDAKSFQNNPMAFYCVATDANTAEPVYHQLDKGEKEDLLWIQASASMPVVSRAVKIDNMELLDGGISDSVPYRYFTSIGYTKNVVVLTQPSSYRKKPFTAKYAKFLQFGLAKYPAIYEKLLNRHEAYNEEIADIVKDEEAGICLVVRPEEDLRIGSICHDKNELTRVYQLGRKAGLNTYKKVIAFLK